MLLSLVIAPIYPNNTQFITNTYKNIYFGSYSSERCILCVFMCVYLSFTNCIQQSVVYKAHWPHAYVTIEAHSLQFVMYCICTLMWPVYLKPQLRIHWKQHRLNSRANIIVGENDTVIITVIMVNLLKSLLSVRCNTSFWLIHNALVI